MSYKSSSIRCIFVVLIMALILNIDTSSPICSVCLAEDGNTIAERIDLSENKHASVLTILIREILDECGIKPIDLSAVALSRGPGSYTGLRISTSVAKGICYGADIPLIGVSTLRGLADSMSSSRSEENVLYVPMLDARRQDVYYAIYAVDGSVIKEDNFATVDEDFLKMAMSYNVKNVYFGGSGAIKAKLICLNMEFGTVIENLICKASNINAISYKQYLDSEFENVTYFEPNYLKEFEGRIKSN